VHQASSALAPSAAAAYPGFNGPIAFVGDKHGVQKLYVHTRGRTVAVLQGGGIANPSYSPLGKRLAVTREVPEIGVGVWVLGADRGDSPRQVTPPELGGTEPTWSPGGRQLAYSAGPIGQRTVHVVGADGVGDRALTAGPADQHDPAWSVRDVIAFSQRNATGEDIYTMPASGGVPRQLTGDPGDDHAPAWSPDGTRLAFIRGSGGVWVMGSRGFGARRVAHVEGAIERGIAWSPDGRWLAFGGGPEGARRIWVVRLDGSRLHPVSLPASNGREPDWRSVGHAPKIAAAGDIACRVDNRAYKDLHGTRHFCAMLRTSDLLLRSDLDAVLPLGDLQYPVGDIGNFYGSFDLSWGRLRYLMKPVPGNHEYRTPGADGYFDYFNGDGVRRGRAGDREAGGYYSYDIGSWHVVALNSNCGSVPGGCGLNSPQQIWLAADLIRHRSRCVLAYWHHPLFSSLAFEEGRGSRATGALWETLYNAGADLVLSGHQHFYERLGPQDANGTADPVRGIRSFVVGTGGRSTDEADVRDKSSEVFDDSTFGVLELRLYKAGYTWRFRHAVNAGPFTDTGHASCH
jgi:hypothetical protein